VIFLTPKDVTAKHQIAPEANKGGADFKHKFEIPGLISGHCQKDRHGNCTSLKCSCDCHKEIA
jgi:hypothetical protein